MATGTNAGVKREHNRECKLHLRGGAGVERGKSFSFGVELGRDRDRRDRA